VIFTWKSSAEPLVCDTDRIADQDPVPPGNASLL
jgi:hypothetical protein